MTLYLVKGLNVYGLCECACHYEAETPEQAIELLRSDQLSNPYVDVPAFSKLRFVATKSKANPAKMAVNYKA